MRERGKKEGAIGQVVLCQYYIVYSTLFNTVFCVSIICMFHIFLLIIYLYIVDYWLVLGLSTYCKPTDLNSLGLVCPERRVLLVACATPSPLEVISRFPHVLRKYGEGRGVHYNEKCFKYKL
jgi:hypothetical protein